MYFNSGAIVLTLFTLTLAAPTPSKIGHVLRRDEDGLLARQASVLSVKTYSQFQVSDGTAGNALDEVNAAFPVDPNNISAGDLQILKDARVVAEDAEVGTGGFNEQIAAADAAGNDSTALQNGKIKNKVLKLRLEVLTNTAEGDTAKAAEEQTKLDNNIKQDTAAAGQASVGVTSTFSGANSSS